MARSLFANIAIHGVVVALIGWTSPTFAGDYAGAIDAQSGTMSQIMRDFSGVQSSINSYWSNMAPRERHLRSVANDAVEYFRDETGRDPTGQDVDFIRSVLDVAGVRNRAEAELVLAQMDDYIRGTRELNETHNSICREASAQGFNFSDC